MLKFIKAYENATLTGFDNLKALMPSQALTPSIYLGSPNGFKLDDEETYDINDQYGLKHLKITVSDVLQKGNLALLDTLDLYSGCNILDEGISGSTNRITKYNNPIDNFFKEKTEAKIAPSPAAPLQFKRVHFYGSLSGVSSEYYSIFLMGNPVPVDASADDYPEGIGSVYPQHPYDDRFIIGGSSTDYPFRVRNVYFDKDGKLFAEIFNGRWVHRYTSTWWIADFFSTETIELDSSAEEQFIFAQLDGNFGLSILHGKEYPVGSSQYMRRAIAAVLIDVSKKTVIKFLNTQIGDIYTW